MSHKLPVLRGESHKGFAETALKLKGGGRQGGEGERDSRALWGGFKETLHDLRRRSNSHVPNNNYNLSLPSPRARALSLSLFPPPPPKPPTQLPPHPPPLTLSSGLTRFCAKSPSIVLCLPPGIGPARDRTLATDAPVLGRRLASGAKSDKSAQVLAYANKQVSALC